MLQLAQTPNRPVGSRMHHTSIILVRNVHRLPQDAELRAQPCKPRGATRRGPCMSAMTKPCKGVTSNRAQEPVT